MKTEAQKKAEMKYRGEKVKQVVVTFSTKDADKVLVSVAGVVLGLVAVVGQRDGVGHLAGRLGLLGHDDERGVHGFPVGIQGGFKDVPGVLWGFVAARRPPNAQRCEPALRARRQDPVASFPRARGWPLGPLWCAPFSPP